MDKSSHLVTDSLCSCKRCICPCRGLCWRKTAAGRAIFRAGSMAVLVHGAPEPVLGTVQGTDRLTRQCRTNNSWGQNTALGVDPRALSLGQEVGSSEPCLDPTAAGPGREPHSWAVLCCSPPAPMLFFPTSPTLLKRPDLHLPPAHSGYCWALPFLSVTLVSHRVLLQHGGALDTQSPAALLPAAAQPCEQPDQLQP